MVDGCFPIFHWVHLNVQAQRPVRCACTCEAIRRPTHAQHLSTLVVGDWTAQASAATQLIWYQIPSAPPTGGDPRYSFGLCSTRPHRWKSNEPLTIKRRLQRGVSGTYIIIVRENDIQYLFIFLSLVWFLNRVLSGPSPRDTCQGDKATDNLAPRIIRITQGTFVFSINCTGINRKSITTQNAKFNLY